MLFRSDSRATEVVIPSEIKGLPVTNIGGRAFYWCQNLTSITIPDSVTNIEEGAFSWCESLTSIIVDENNQYYSDIDGVLFNKEKTTIIKYPCGKTSSEYEIPNFVTEIDRNAFYNSTNLTSIIISDSVTIINESAFRDWYRLSTITIPGSVTSISGGESK